MEHRLQPGPVNPEVLTQQETHRSKAIWDGDDKGSLRCRSHLAMHKGFLVSDRVVDFIRESQFYFIHRVVGLKFNVDFITALVERWRPEIHSFHMTVGEATVILQDVQVLLGLRIIGDVVTGPTTYNWRALIYELDALDNMRPDQFIWQPYPQPTISFLPESCYDDSSEWYVVSPMICFNIVEWHLPNRVARQFGWKQNIPEHADTEPKLHKMDTRGAHTRNWADYHSPYIAMWSKRTQFRFLGVEDNNDMGYNDPYMAYGFAEVHTTCNTEIQAMPQEVPPHYRNIMSNIRDNSSQSLDHVGRRSRCTNTSMSPINEQGTPEPSKEKRIWSRLRGKKKT
ncbi:hypothetical protein KSS87_005492 [Heliosperma pusillum]|nr:hypothetical protein KSS87_005492 [Heliosperma pusillum]